IQAATCPVTNLAVNYPQTVTPGQWVQIQVTVIVACSPSAFGGQYQGTIQLMPTGITRVITTQAISGPVTSVIVTAPTVTGPWNITVVVTIIDETYGLGRVDSITNQPISIQVQNPVSYLTNSYDICNINRHSRYTNFNIHKHDSPVDLTNSSRSTIPAILYGPLSNRLRGRALHVTSNSTEENNRRHEG